MVRPNTETKRIIIAAHPTVHAHSNSRFNENPIQIFTGYRGIFGADTISLPGAINTSLSWSGLFACFDNQFFCPESNSSTCLDRNTACPAKLPTELPPKEACPDGNGLEAG